MNLIKNYDLTQSNTLGLASKAECFAAFSSIEQCQALILAAHNQGLKLKVLGGGSNLILAPKISGLVIQSDMQDFTLHKQSDEFSWVWVDAGVNWHNWVNKSIEFGHGLENLALIPGTVGAAPVQNIGAYGVEVAEFIEQIELIDFKEAHIQTLSNEDCQFAYRDSAFKQNFKDKAVITRVLFKLPRAFKPKLDYAPLSELKPQAEARELNAQALIAKVCEIRNSKLPDPKHIANAGSFFKNPIISSSQLEALKEQYPNIPHYSYGHYASDDEQHFKVAAGWLIEQCGFKGKWHGKVGMYEKQALVMVARQGAAAQDIQSLSQKIISQVQQSFQIQLEVEPQLFN